MFRSLPIDTQRKLHSTSRMFVYTIRSSLNVCKSKRATGRGIKRRKEGILSKHMRF
jgi:hypothetical protein